jgi:hypothetical protein
MSTDPNGPNRPLRRRLPPDWVREPIEPEEDEAPEAEQE